MNPKGHEVAAVQKLCEQIVEQWYDEFAVLRSDIASAVKIVAQVWEEQYGDPNNMHGQMHCTDVRGMLLLNRVGFSNPDKDPPPGVLYTRYGQGMSVVLRDGQGMRVRVRKAPAEFIPDQGERLVIKVPRAAKTVEPVTVTDAALVEQPALSDEMANLQRTEKKYEWFVLWTLSSDALQVTDVFLAAVSDIDSPSQVVIWASTPLPRKERPLSAVDEDVDDFEEFGKNDGEESAGPGSA